MLLTVGFLAALSGTFHSVSSLAGHEVGGAISSNRPNLCTSNSLWGRALVCGTIPMQQGLMRLRGGKVGGVKARDLWDKSLDELSSMEEELRSELMSLRVAQQVGGQPAKVNKIKLVRKSIARVLTVTTSKRRADGFKAVEKDKRKPYDTRDNRHMTKAMRQRPNKHERELKSLRALRCIQSQVKTGRATPEERSMADHPPHRYGARGRYTATGHIPEHAKMAMMRRKQKWEEEKKRLKAFKERLANR